MNTKEIRINNLLMKYSLDTKEEDYKYLLQEYVKPILDAANCKSIDEVIEKLKHPTPDRWISVEDRLPTKEDADKEGNVLAWDELQDKAVEVIYASVSKMKIRFKFWQPLPTKPQK